MYDNIKLINSVNIIYMVVNVVSLPLSHSVVDSDSDSDSAGAVVGGVHEVLFCIAIAIIVHG